MCTIFVHCALVWGSWAAAHSPLFGRFMVLKMRNFLRGALPRTPLGLPAPDPRLGLCPRPRVRRCRRPEAELRLQAKVARCRLSSKKIAIYGSLRGSEANSAVRAPGGSGWRGCVSSGRGDSGSLRTHLAMTAWSEVTVAVLGGSAAAAIAARTTAALATLTANRFSVDDGEARPLPPLWAQLLCGHATLSPTSSPPLPVCSITRPSQA